MIVVSDASPFVVLIQIEQSGILERLFGKVLLPTPVLGELTLPGRPAAVRTWAASPPDWVEIRSPVSSRRIEGLHGGESSAILLAEETRADLLLIDEAQGRRIAHQRGLPIVGTVGLLEMAARSDLLDLEAAFLAVRRTDFWVSSRFLDERLARFRGSSGQ